MYFAAREGFKFSPRASMIAALLYSTSPRVVSYLEAGHVGLVLSWAWVPLVILTIAKIARSPKFGWTILLAISMAALFQTHTITFLITAVATPVLLLLTKKQSLPKSFLHFSLAAIIGFGLVAINFLPQMAWKDLTTRTLLTKKPQVFPVWESKEEFLTNVFIPVLNKDGLGQINTEKFLVLGLVPSVLAGIGFLKLSNAKKILILCAAGLITAIALSNASPFYDIFIGQEWYQTMRVPTRVWFLVIIFIALLAGYAVEKIKIGKLITFLAIAESIIISWSYLAKPIQKRDFVSQEVYNFLNQDQDQYRVFCIDRCIPQKEAVKHNLELIEGHSTLTQLNYLSRSWALTGGYWDDYSLSTPPIGVYKFQRLQPDAIALGEQNTKYVISPHELADSNFEPLKKYGNYILYLNKAWQPRVGIPITYYSPNKIILATSEVAGGSINLSEVYSPGWNAYLNGKEKVPVQETPVHLRSINTKPDTHFVELKYEPETYFIGRSITFSTILIISIYAIKKCIRMAETLTKYKKILRRKIAAKATKVVKYQGRIKVK